VPNNDRECILFFCVLSKISIMVERKLCRMSYSLVRDVEEISSETCCTEAEANNASQETELDRSVVEIDEEMNTDTVGQIKDLFNSNDVIHSRLHPSDMSFV